MQEEEATYHSMLAPICVNPNSSISTPLLLSTHLHLKTGTKNIGIITFLVPIFGINIQFNIVVLKKKLVQVF